MDKLYFCCTSNLILGTKEGMGSDALLFAILTAARSGEVTGATWKEIDFSKSIWTISASRMKAQKEHVVPLSRQALGLLQELHTQEISGYIFQNARGSALSDATMNAVIKRLHTESITVGLDGFKDPHSGRRVTPHGFRSTFKEWSRQDHRYPDEWSELALAHVNNDKTRAAYARSKLFDERKGMMQEWADYCFLENEQA